MSPGLDGLLLIDKPPGPTSHDVVARVRRVLGVARVGHAGTLDPPASGLLPLVLGSSTRLVRYLPDSPKGYVGRLQLGVVTSTDDAHGAVLSRHDRPLPPAAVVLEAAERLRGRSHQIPPAVSAKKIEGERMYRLARRGVAVDAPAVPVDVFRFELVAEDEAAGIYRFEADVSPGTYVRALARDLGAGLGCGGGLIELRRTRVGPWTVAEAFALPAHADPAPAALRAAIVPPEAIPLTPPAVRLEGLDAARRFRSGNPVRLPTGPAAGTVSVLSAEGALLGIGDWAPPVLLPRVVLPPREA